MSMEMVSLNSVDIILSDREGLVQLYVIEASSEKLYDFVTCASSKKVPRA
jgi:deoxycytidine triphosphate deaminase